MVISCGGQEVVAVVVAVVSSSRGGDAHHGVDVEEGLMAKSASRSALLVLLSSVTSDTMDELRVKE